MIWATDERGPFERNERLVATLLLVGCTHATPVELSELTAMVEAQKRFVRDKWGREPVRECNVDDLLRSDDREVALLVVVAISIYDTDDPKTDVNYGWSFSRVADEVGQMFRCWLCGTAKTDEVLSFLDATLEKLFERIGASVFCFF